MSEYFLGVDGGQSSTTALIGDADGKIVGWATGGPCNHVTAAEAKAKFLRVMKECLSQAAARAGLASPVAFKAACFGMSGGPADKAALLRELVESEHWIVTDDATVALAGATAGEPGIVAIAGTGSIAFGQNARGEVARAGGWGYLFGDEGSAFDIVRQALRAVLREHEGWGARTALTPALIEATSVSDANELLHIFYTPDWPRQRVAGMAGIVNQIAEDGDPIAVNILHNAAQELALLVGSVRRQLWTEGESARVAWTGGVFNSAILLERFRTLVSIEENTICEPPRRDPAFGALLLAYKAAGIRPAQLGLTETDR
ncbi:MAG TPA: BadF/BadG/BcrA/BcrD ATPase family protein [Bryobacteraceae bacterium]|jgi:N-acetylglucosamine kinase-like BadF-type ATPase|nr:BadF/BadG/BcrA/BcrD ATPase family protein [Bryobacteraceae bacterium]